MNKYRVCVEFEIGGMDEREAQKTLCVALRERIDGHLLAAQRQAIFLGIVPGA